jgi:S-(hydroxymethyl)glutathione dehydrogenase / alcohol dehydrogenase
LVEFAKAAVLEKIGKPLSIKTIKIPKLKKGQVLVKVYFSGVCRSQLMEVQGARGNDKWLPHLLGHEGSGIVDCVGEGVTKVKKGDEVILGWIKGKGFDVSGAKYKNNEKLINSGGVTTFSNYSIVSENRLVKKPKWVPFDEAVLFGCALPTGGGMALHNFKKSYKVITIVGLGGIGLSSLITLKALGAEKIIAIDTIKDKREMALEYGAYVCLNPKDKKFKKDYDNYAPFGSDLCIEAGGSINSIELGFSLINAFKGLLVFASHPPDGKTISLLPHELISGKKIIGSWGGGINPDKDINTLCKILYKKKGVLSKFVNKKYSLEDINMALEDLSTGNILRPIIKMRH